MEFYLYYNDNIVIDFIGKFENYEKDFISLFEKLNLEIDVVPHKKASKHKHYSTFYDDEAIKIVADMYKKDIELFSYKFDKV